MLRKKAGWWSRSIRAAIGTFPEGASVPVIMAALGPLNSREQKTCASIISTMGTKGRILREGTRGNYTYKVNPNMVEFEEKKTIHPQCDSTKAYECDIISPGPPMFSMGLNYANCARAN